MMDLEGEYEGVRARYEQLVNQLNQQRQAIQQTEQQAVELQGVLKYLDSKRQPPEETSDGPEPPE